MPPIAYFLIAFGLFVVALAVTWTFRNTHHKVPLANDGPRARQHRSVRRTRRVAALSMRLGIMGGTFDPIHHGHLVAASEVAHLFELDEVVFVPTGQPWMKEGRHVRCRGPLPHDGDRDRLQPAFWVSRVDVERPGKTFTIDTLREIRDNRRTTSCTSSPAPTLWARSCRGRTRIRSVDLAHFVGVPDPVTTSPIRVCPARGDPPGGARLAISSTACRERVRDGSRSGIWCRTESSSTSTSTSLYSYAAGRPRRVEHEEIRDRHRQGRPAGQGRRPRSGGEARREDRRLRRQRAAPLTDVFLLASAGSSGRSARSSTRSRSGCRDADASRSAARGARGPMGAHRLR